MGLSRGSYPAVILAAVIIIDTLGLALGIASYHALLRHKGRVDRGVSGASSISSSISSLTTSCTQAGGGQGAFNSNGSGGTIIPIPPSTGTTTTTKSSFPRSCTPCLFLDGSGIKGIFISLLLTYLGSFILIGAVALLGKSLFLFSPLLSASFHSPLPLFSPQLLI